MDGNGAWIIESTGSESDNVYEFLVENENGPRAVETLRELMLNKKAGTMQIRFHGQDSLLCFLPKGNSYNWYLLSVMPKSVLQQESSEIINMVIITFAELAGALLLITALLLSRESMKGREQGRIYRERLFQNISSNIDFAFLLYAPSSQQVEMVSDNIRVLYDTEPDQVISRPEILFEQCGVPADDKDRAAFSGEVLRKRSGKSTGQARKTNFSGGQKCIFSRRMTGSIWLFCGTPQESTICGPIWRMLSGSPRKITGPGPRSFHPCPMISEPR